MSFQYTDLIQALNSNKVSYQSFILKLLNQETEFYWHPLGFIHCKVFEYNNKKIRLHIWHQDFNKAQSPEWLIHNHTFDLKSWVLLGSIRNTSFKLKLVTSGKPLYRSHLKDNVSILSKTKFFVETLIDNVSIIHSANSYCVENGVYHQSESLDNLSITICETIDKNIRGPFVVGESNGEDEYRYERKKLNKAELTKLKDFILE